MNLVSKLVAGTLLLTFGGVASAAVVTFQPSPVDLWDLDHYKAFTWRIDWSVPEGERLVSAELLFENVRNWDDNSYDLWGHLLDYVDATEYFADDQDGSDYFAELPGLLFHWDYTGGSDPHEIPLDSEGGKDVTYSFTVEQLGWLESYSADGSFGLGFDPDCHFWNNGITLRLQTQSVPEPTAPFLLLAGVSLLFIRRRSR